ncbi:MAG: 3-phosphoshikimate 1-carboxyvinyltransferase [Anaeroplasmataceae bacterium]
MNVIITPNKLKGSIDIPSSKSITHRAIIAACLASGKSTISNIVYSNDIKATINCMRSLGAIIKEFDDYVEIDGSSIKRLSNFINADESGSTMRFLIPICLTVDSKITFLASESLKKRPIDTYLDIFDKQNIKYDIEERSFPLTVHNGLKPGIFELEANISSQYITGLLFALPLLNKDSKIILTTNLESKGYVDLTLDILKKFNIEVINHDYKSFEIKGNQIYKPTDMMVEADYSQAAFFLVANTLGSNITINNLVEDSKQADYKIIDDINKFKGACLFKNNKLVCKPANTMATIIDLKDSPDLGPILSLLASLSEGESKLINAKRLRIKESDRISCVKSELEKLGVTVKESLDSLTIYGRNNLKGSLDLYSHNDHRIVMMLAIASTVCDSKIKIHNAEAVNKSYPNFFEDFIKLGGVIEYEQ